jgi:hypothetical protein
LPGQRTGQQETRPAGPRQDAAGWDQAQRLLREQVQKAAVEAVETVPGFDPDQASKNSDRELNSMYTKFFQEKN